MKIVYLVFTHKNERQIKRLVARLRTGSNSFLLIHHDHSKGVALPFQNGSDLHVIPDYVPIKWGDASLLLATLRSLSWLEKERFEFDWLITISGQDYPVQPPRSIEAFLNSTAHDAFVAHELIHEDPARHQRSWQTMCLRHYFYHSVRLFGREYRLKRRHPYRNGFDCYAGSNWMNLSRRAVEYLWSKKEMTARLVSYLKGTFGPDETLFQTVLLNGSGLNIASDDKRFVLWRDDLPNPLMLCLDHLEAIVGSGAFFARKFDDTVCPEVLDQLDEVIQPASFQEAKFRCDQGHVPRL